MMYSNTESKMEAITCEEFYDDVAFEGLHELLAEMAADEVNGLLQVAADEARQAEIFERWVEEVGSMFLSTEDVR